MALDADHLCGARLDGFPDQFMTRHPRLPSGSFLSAREYYAKSNGVRPGNAIGNLGNKTYISRAGPA